MIAIGIVLLVVVELEQQVRMAFTGRVTDLTRKKRNQN